MSGRRPRGRFGSSVRLCSRCEGAGDGEYAGGGEYEEGGGALFPIVCEKGARFGGGGGASRLGSGMSFTVRPHFRQYTSLP
jgi:hypothetical protein